MNDYFNIRFVHSLNYLILISFLLLLLLSKKEMVIAYIRVSTEKQHLVNQRKEIERYLERFNMRVDAWKEEVISGTVNREDRLLGEVVDSLNKEDVIIVSELSRLSRSAFGICEILHTCEQKGITLMSVKENYTLTDDLTSRVLSMSFGIMAEIERRLISMRTKEALARKKAEGVQLGRPKGSNTKTRILFTNKENIVEMILSGIPIVRIAKKFNVSRPTFYKFLKTHSMDLHKKKVYQENAD